MAECVPEITRKITPKTIKETPHCVSVVEPTSEQINSLSTLSENTHKCFIDLHFQFKDEMRVDPNALLFLTTEGRMEGRQKAYRLRQITAVFNHPRLKRPW